MHLSLAIIISLIFVSLSIAYPMQGSKTGELARFKKYQEILQKAQAWQIHTDEKVSIGSSVRIRQGSLDPNDLRTGKALRDGDDLRLIMVPVIGVTGYEVTVAPIVAGSPEGGRQPKIWVKAATYFDGLGDENAIIDLSRKKQVPKTELFWPADGKRQTQFKLKSGMEGALCKLAADGNGELVDGNGGLADGKGELAYKGNYAEGLGGESDPGPELESEPERENDPEPAQGGPPSPSRIGATSGRPRYKVAPEPRRAQSLNRIVNQRRTSER